MPYLPYGIGILGVIVYGVVGGLAGRGSGGLLGAVRGEDGRLSSSKFQFFLWTGVVIFVWVALFVASAIHPGVKCAQSSPPRPDMPTNVLLAMGFSVITLATAKGVTTAYVYAGRVAKGSNNAWKWSDLVCTDDGVSPDLTKIQMLTWTFIAAGSYLYTAIAQVASYDAALNGGAAPPCGLPDINAALMALMGIGQGAYLGTKIVGSSTIVLRNLSKPQTFAGDTVIINGSGFGTTPGSVYFGPVAASLAPGKSAWSDTAIQVIVPAVNSDDNQPFEPGDTVSVGILLTGSSGTSSTGNTLPFTYTAAPPSSTTTAANSRATPSAQAPSGGVSVTADEAEAAVRAWLDEHLEIRTVAEGQPPSRDPLLYRLNMARNPEAPVMSVKGPVLPPSPARYAFFIDHHPHTNWEHWCSYVFVDDAGNVSVVDSTVPPSSKTEAARVRLPYSRP
jgi:hypothetical protein